MRDHYSQNMLMATVKAVVNPGPLLNAPGEARLSYGRIFRNLLAALCPLVFGIALAAGTWWYAVIHPESQFRESQAVFAIALPGPDAVTPTAKKPAEEEALVEIGSDTVSSGRSSSANSSGAPVALDADPDNKDSNQPQEYVGPSTNFYI